MGSINHGQMFLWEVSYEIYSDYGTCRGNTEHTDYIASEEDSIDAVRRSIVPSLAHYQRISKIKKATLLGVVRVPIRSAV